MKEIKLPEKLDMIHLKSSIESIKKKNNRKKARILFKKMVKLVKAKKSAEIEK